MIETTPQPPRALVVTLAMERRTDWQIMRAEQEAFSLLDTLGIQVAGSISFYVKEPSSATLIGKGQLEEVAEHRRFFDCDIVYFDTSLNPRVDRNLERALECPVMDRNELIIEIFASRARTWEARLQVQLARLQFLLPRLKQSTAAYAQQRGGVRGAKGEGERQIELDRRRLEAEMTRLRREIGIVKRNRDTQRKRRLASSTPSFALVGYTNSGKSSLLKALTGQDTLCEDKLFATLDPLERTMELERGLTAIVSDTVGFVSNLPHSLIEAFSSTLEEATLSDVLILVLDASSDDVDENYRTTLSVLEELGAKDKPMILVFNKGDLPVSNEVAVSSIRALHPDAVMASAKTGENLDRLKERMRNEARRIVGTTKVTLAVDDTEGIRKAYASGKVIGVDYGVDRVVFTMRTR